MFSGKDKKQINDKAIDMDTVKKQIRNFEEGFPFLDISTPATLKKGIRTIEKSEILYYTQLYEKVLTDTQPVKFIPSSGAASRMFKFLFEFLETHDQQEKPILVSQQTDFFFKNLSSFVFYKDLEKIYFKQIGNTLKEDLIQKKHNNILSVLLEEKGLNYGNLPKGLILFHKYKDHNRTALEEHLVEGANYLRNQEKKVVLHITVSPEHLEKFHKKIANVIEWYEEKLDVKYQISFSIQKSYTDIVAVDKNNQPFRNKDGSLLFRPGGHGALIENLNEITADIIFIKNIDNVVPDRLKPQTHKYKKVLAGLLLEIREKIFNFLKELSINSEEKFLTEVADFMKNQLCVLPPVDFASYNKEQKISYLKRKFNRPIRVCGMVKNQGEPGGGPFWAKNTDGSTSLQIAEANQIDIQNPEIKDILKEVTHFSPVDLVCGTKNYQGKKFDLLQYRDPDTGFISEKSKNGKILKAQELPGLWNGAMSDWNTVFVEVPTATFNPVKTINDLLRSNHQ